MKSYTFSKGDRLKSKKALTSLFEHGKKVKNQLFTLVYIENIERKNPIVKLAVSVPKRNVKKAVDRNRLKRLIKEVYRLRQPPFIDGIKDLDAAYDIMLIYHGNVNGTYKDIENKIMLLLNRFSEKLHAENPS